MNQLITIYFLINIIKISIKIFIPFRSAIESKKHQGASVPVPHFTNVT